MTSIQTLTNRTLARLNAATRATERMAADPTPRNRTREQDAWEAYARARRAEVEARVAARNARLARTV